MPSHAARHAERLPALNGEVPAADRAVRPSASQSPRGISEGALDFFSPGSVLGHVLLTQAFGANPFRLLHFRFNLVGAPLEASDCESASDFQDFQIIVVHRLDPLYRFELANLLTG
jgi:hypothetical protein